MENKNIYKNIQHQLSKKNAVLVAVSKTHPSSAIQEMYDWGQRIFGENRVQELVEKWEVLPKDIEWHLIGHLQRNKVKYIAPFVSLIHSVDSPRLLKEINKEAQKTERVIDVLLQFHIATEDTKYGFSYDEVIDLLDSELFKSMKYIRVVGVMGMASFVDDEKQVRREFSNLKQYFTQLKNTFFKEVDYFQTVSMGMSGDYELALQEGSTMVRIGSLLFGNRTNQ